jgi:hypothetical protein
MRGSVDTVGMPGFKSRSVGFRFEIVSQNRLQELRLECTPNCFHSDMRAARSPFLGMRFWRIFSLVFLSSSSVAAFRSSNSDSRNEVYFGASRQAREIIVPEAPDSHAAFLSIHRDYPSEGERCMKDTDHPIVHPLRHPRIFGRVRRERGCTSRTDQFGRGQGTGLGWSDPTFVHGSVP